MKIREIDENLGLAYLNSGDNAMKDLAEYFSNTFRYSDGKLDFRRDLIGMFARAIYAQGKFVGLSSGVKYQIRGNEVPDVTEEREYVVGENSVVAVSPRFRQRGIGRFLFVDCFRQLLYFDPEFLLVKTTNQIMFRTVGDTLYSNNVDFIPDGTKNRCNFWVDVRQLRNAEKIMEMAERVKL